MYRQITFVLLPAALAACFEPAETETEAVAWETFSPTQENSSTHLWIVNRAVDQLGRQTSTKARAAHQLLTKSTCKKQWQQGLFDADYKAPYHGGWSDLKVGASELQIAASGATWASHFYDPSTGVNYLGQSTPTARTEALKHGATARTKIRANDLAGGCYALGLALHYFTDITQPMHGANFTATDTPLTLHSHLEEYAVEIQNRYAITTTATLTVGTTADEVEQAAWVSHGQWPALYGAVEATYASRCIDIALFPTDVSSCWEGAATVDTQVGASLRTAQTATAEFVLALDL